MRNHKSLSSWVTVSLFALATLSAKVARADESGCKTDTDCGKGWSCQVTGGASCAGAPDCPPGAACDPPLPCSDIVIKSCVPAPCGTDADCAGGMVCHQGAVACPAIACAKGDNCPPVVCDPGPKQCTPKYQLPCAADADCGAGFTCGFGEACSGGTSAADAGTPSKSGAAGSANVPTDTTTCTRSTIGSCQLTPVACKKDTECQAGWSCVDVLAGYGCVEASPAPMSGGAMSGSADGTPPPSMGGSAGGTPPPSMGGSADNGSPQPSADGGAPVPSMGGSSAGYMGTVCPPPPAPLLQCTPPGYSYGYVGVGFDSTAASGGATSASASGSGLPTPAAPARGAADANGTTGPAASTSCSVSIPGGASNGGLMLLALGLFGFVRRRRVAARS